MRLVDTDVLVDILRSHGPALAWFGSLEELPATAGFSVMELLAGCPDEPAARSSGDTRVPGTPQSSGDTILNCPQSSGDAIRGEFRGHHT
jgi:hypothetical protein